MKKMHTLLFFRKSAQVNRIILLLILLINATLTMAQPPVISSVEPEMGGAGTTVTLTGSRFTNVSQVRFGGVKAASFMVVSPTKIVAVVGVGATGRVSVTTAAGTGNGGFFTFFPAPTITSVTPRRAPLQAEVTIHGTNLRLIEEVRFGGGWAYFELVDDTTLLTFVPYNAVSGSLTVQTPGGVASISDFRVLRVPVITSFTPSSGRTGTVVTITGQNFEDIQSVTFGVTAPAASFTVVSPTTITAVVGSGASGTIGIRNPAGIGSSTGIFHYIQTAANSNGAPAELSAYLVQSPGDQQPHVSINTSGQERVTITLANESGRALPAQVANLSSGNNVIRINNFTSLKPGTYAVTITSAKRVVKTFKVIKL
jgi:hypothetical protein